MPKIKLDPYNQPIFDRLQVRLRRLLRDLRKKSGLKLKDAAKASGISAGTLSKVERGTAEVGLEHLLALGFVYGVDVEWFFKESHDGGEGETA